MDELISQAQKALDKDDMTEYERIQELVRKEIEKEGN